MNHHRSDLFDAHPPFQIDGNFGGATGIVEMLIQSHLDELDISPALPSDNPDGQIRVLRARGGYNPNLEWKGGHLVHLKVLSKSGFPLKLKYGNKNFSARTKRGEIFQFNHDI